MSMGTAHPDLYEIPRPSGTDDRRRLLKVAGPIRTLPLTPRFETFSQLLRPVLIRRWYRNPTTPPRSLPVTSYLSMSSLDRAALRPRRVVRAACRVSLRRGQGPAPRRCWSGRG